MAGGVTKTGEGTKSTTKIFANIFISFIGSGVLGLPYAFKEAGILEGVLVLTLVALISVKAMLLVIDCKYMLIEKRQPRKRDLKNPEEMENLIDGLETQTTTEEILPAAKPGEELSYGDVGFHAFGNLGRILVEWAIILSQTGFCCAYLLFISSNLSNYIPSVPKSLNFLFLLTIIHVVNSSQSMVPQSIFNGWLICFNLLNYWLIGLLPMEFCLCLFRNLKKLAITSLFAQVSNLMAFGVVFWFDFEQFHRIKHGVHPKEWSWSGLPFFLCVAIYCYEGAGMILSLEASLHKDLRHNFRRFFLTTMVAVTLLYATFGACGYASFGSATEDIITLNLPKPASGGLDFATLVTSCLCLSLFFTYPVMLFPVFSIFDMKMGVTPDGSQIKSNIMRVVLVLITGIVVLIIPDFGNLMALIGATCCVWLAFILPAVFHMRICGQNITQLQRIVNCIIIGLGVIGTIVGLIDAIGRMTGHIQTTHKHAQDIIICDNCVSTSTVASLITNGSVSVSHIVNNTST